MNFKVIFFLYFQSRKLEDKDRQLQKKVSELQTQTQRLERKITLLKTENDTLVSITSYCRSIDFSAAENGKQGWLVVLGVTTF